MRCKACNYALWNLPGRTCPECGTGFRPSDFDFVPSAVKFCCPRCMQAYYGTTWRGHLMPMEFSCVSCGSWVHMDEMVVLPGEGVDEGRTVQGANPWLDRRRGLFGRFFASIGHALVKPTEMARGTPMGSSQAAAGAFAVLVHVFAYAVCWGPQALLMGMAGAAGVGAGLGFIGFFVVLAVVWTWVWGLLAHLLLKATGSTAGGLGRTMLALYYSAGANVASAVPCLGFMFGWIWWMVSAVSMVREMQRVSGGRAALACVLPPVVGAGLVVGGYAWFLASTMTQITQAQARAAAAQQAATVGGGTVPGAGVQTPAIAGDRVFEGVRMWSRDNGGGLPGHPASLIASRYVELGSFFVLGSASSDQSAWVGGTSLRDLDLKPSGERVDAFRVAMERERVGGSVGGGWTRLGDVLLADVGGLTLEEASRAGLWVVAVSVDPKANPWRVSAGVVMEGFTVVTGDGTVRAIGADEVEAALEQQNEARRGVGLGEVGDPRRVEHAMPGGR